MSTWTFEPGHTQVRFRARHMMVAYVEGMFKDIHGRLDWDPEDPGSASCHATIDARRLWTGEEQRDAHLRSPDFFDTDNHPTVTFRSTGVEQRSNTELLLHGDLTIRGITRPITANVVHIGTWDTPYWESKDDEWRNFGPVRRAGFTATLTVQRQDWNVRWQDKVDREGVVVGDDISLRIDVEALRDEDVERAQRQVREWKG